MAKATARGICLGPQAVANIGNADSISEARDALPHPMRPGSIICLLGNPLTEALNVDDGSLVSASAYQLLLTERFLANLHAKRQPPSIDFNQFGGGLDLKTHRRGRQMAHIEMNTHSAIPHGQQMIHGCDPSALHKKHHLWSS
jgi:hypothetical protein